MAKEGNIVSTGTGDLFGAKPDASSKTTYRIPASPSNYRNMSEQKKQEQDFTKEVDAILPTTTKLAQVSSIGRSTSCIEIECSYSRANYSKPWMNCLC